MVEQLGLAIICGFDDSLIKLPFTSGTKSNTSAFMRKAFELSMAKAPALTASGAHSLEMSSPDEKKTISNPSKQFGFKTCTVQVLPPTSSFWPSDWLLANGRNSLIGKAYSSRILIKVSPTTPVAPTSPTFKGFFQGFMCPLQILLASQFRWFHLEHKHWLLFLVVFCLNAIFQK